MGHEPVHPIDTRSHMRLRARVRRIYNKGFAVAFGLCSRFRTTSPLDTWQRDTWQRVHTHCVDCPQLPNLPASHTLPWQEVTPSSLDHWPAGPTSQPCPLAAFMNLPAHMQRIWRTLCPIVCISREGSRPMCIAPLLLQHCTCQRDSHDKNQSDHWRTSPVCDPLCTLPAGMAGRDSAPAPTFCACREAPSELELPSYSPSPCGLYKCKEPRLEPACGVVLIAGSRAGETTHTTLSPARASPEALAQQQKSHTGGV